MKNLLLIKSLLLLFSMILMASDDDYLVFKDKKYEIVYTKMYEKEANYIKSNLDELLKANDKSFGYSFDEPLKIVLVSDKTQISNAFSTQIPYNLTTFYNGGSSMIDYFGTTSWINTILNHEVAHNYQLNAKKSSVSKNLHKYLGNNYMPIFVGFIPFFTLPNLYLPTVLLEGNAVLNESIYNNGGRLYSGRFQALKNALMQNNKINTNSLINNNLDFPYTEAKYIIGGFYMKFLAKKYGIDRVNSFFYNHSEHFINPFILNEAFLMTFKQTFASSINEFIAQDKKENNNFKTLQDGIFIAKSKRQIYINKHKNNIYFETSDLKNRATLYKIDTNTSEIKTTSTRLKNGLIFELNNKLYSSADGFISKDFYKNGLFDDDANIHPNTIGRNIQDMNDNNIIYFDIQKSYDRPALYKNEEFIDFAASGAIIDNKNNIYYMKQEGIKRTIIKNKEQIYSYDGYYGKVVDVVEDNIYFIANSDFGSTLYKQTPNGIFRISYADNIIDAKLLDDKTLLVVTINSDGYNIVKIQNNKQQLIESIAETKPIQNTQNFSFDTSKQSELLNSKKYNELRNLEYSMLYPSYGYDSQNGSIYSLDGFFTDPMMFNSLNLSIKKDYDERIAGATYRNNRYFNFQLSLYDIDKTEKTLEERGYFIKSLLSTEYYKNDLTALGLSFSYYLDNDFKDKNPTTLSTSYDYKEEYSLGYKPYLNIFINTFAQKDRDNNIFGITADVGHHIFGDTYIGLGAKKLNSTLMDSSKYKGIRLVNKPINTTKDIANTLVQGLKDDVFVKNISSVGFNFSSTFYANRYFESFPISLRKESLFGSYEHYDVTTTKYSLIKEIAVGIEFDFLLAHKFNLPVIIKHIKNEFDDKPNNKTLIYINTSF